MKRGYFTNFSDAEIAQLTNPKHKTVIKLRRQNWTMARIAEFMDTKTSHVCSWCHRAARHLDEIKRLETEPAHCKVKVVRH